MALSRPLLLTLVGAMLMTATFLAARGARTAAEPASQAAMVVPTPPKAKAAAKPDVVNKSKARDGGKPRADKAKEGGGAPAAKPKPKPATPRAPPVSATPGVPGPVARALGRKQVIVLFFRQRAADDSATAAAVRSVRGTKGVAVFQAPIAQLAKYRGLVSALGIAQAPAVVVVDRTRQAQILEGYLDSASLNQIVKDAR